MDVQYYTSDNVVVTNGIVSMIGDVNTVPRIQHSAKISEGNSGGPLLNADGVVIGVNALGVNNDYFYATQIGEVISIMKSMGYQYTSGSAPIETEAPETTGESTESVETEPATTESTEAPAQDTTSERAALQGEIDEADKVDVSKYTEDSVGDFEEALENANAALAAVDASATELELAANYLSTARTALVEKKSNMMMYIVIGAAAVVVVVIIIIIVAVSSGKKKKAQQANRRPSVPPTSGAGSVPPASGSTGRGFNPSPAAPPVSAPGGNCGETSVLDAGAGETTVLSGGGVVSNGYLIRKKTGEKIELRKSVFVIGKERSKVDYCISDNTSISRVHVKLLAKGDGCYIVDQKSTNSTFVNGSKLTPLVEMKLEDRATVKLSDELFEYHKG